MCADILNAPLKVKIKIISKGVKLSVKLGNFFIQSKLELEASLIGQCIIKLSQFLGSFISAMIDERHSCPQREEDGDIRSNLPKQLPR